MRKIILHVLDLLRQFWRRLFSRSKSVPVLQQEDSASISNANDHDIQREISTINPENQSIPTKIIFGNEELPFAELFRYTPSSDEQVEDVPLNPGLLDSLQVILNQAPNLSATTEELISSRYIVKFSPEVTKGLARGTLALMKSGANFKAIAVNQANKAAVEIATVSKIPAPSPTTMALAIWQVLAIITSQKYLADINKRLKLIEDGINDLKRWLENDRLSKLFGSFSYLCSQSSQFSNSLHSLTENDIHAFADALEHIELECRQLMAGYDLEMEEHKRIFRNEKFHYEWRLNTDNIKIAGSQIEGHMKQEQGFLIASHLRETVSKLRCALPLSKEVALNRLEELNNQLIDKKVDIEDFHRYIESRIPAVYGEASFNSTDKAYKELLRQHLKNARKLHNSSFDKIINNIENTKYILESEISNLDRQIELIVDLNEKGSIEKVKKLTNGS